MSKLTNAFYTAVSLVLMGFAAALVAIGPISLIHALLTGRPFVTAMVNSLGYLILSLAVFDVARYVFDEEVTRGREMRNAAETRRSITKFITVIIIAVLMDALVALSKAGQADLNQLVYPVVLVAGGGGLLLILGIYQRLSATVEEKVGASDEADEAAKAAEQA
ncbi:GNAT family acetyltransferase [Phenylobacterium deserti]|uniref:GNAT family acetyltransferase n=1 Tax=Phenylobacterium deserti TaxID=1914756 RepID=A0A328ASG4_9CAUL|nr:GNAT family acetyltransferase [Phenylobacterium deserti]RAK58012.1 GNAT family acetyltransferase [Phenylobacterium deserti]